MKTMGTMVPMVHVMGYLTILPKVLKKEKKWGGMIKAKKEK